MTFTLEVLHRLQDEVDREVEAAENLTGVENPQLRALLEMIRV